MSRPARSGFVVAVGVAATLSGAAASPEASKPQPGDGALAQRLRAASRSVGGTVGIAIIHVETGRTVEVQGARPLPLYSVFKLPLAVAILKDAEDGRLRLDQKVRITPGRGGAGRAGEHGPLEAADGADHPRAARALHRAQRQHLDRQAAWSWRAVPAPLTRRLSALGITGITVRRSVREFLTDRAAPHGNTASALDLARLLSRMQKGEILRADSRQTLFGFMAAATTGLQRLRAGVPAGTPVADKTGSGPGGSATNDVGIITLPDGSHVAVAVLVSGSKRPVPAQEAADRRPGAGGLRRVRRRSAPAVDPEAEAVRIVHGQVPAEARLVLGLGGQAPPAPLMRAARASMSCSVSHQRLNPTPFLRSRPLAQSSCERPSRLFPAFSSTPCTLPPSVQRSSTTKPTTCV